MSLQLYVLEIWSPDGDRFSLEQRASRTPQGAETWAKERASHEALGAPRCTTSWCATKVACVSSMGLDPSTSTTSSSCRMGVEKGDLPEEGLLPPSHTTPTSLIRFVGAGSAVVRKPPVAQLAQHAIIAQQESEMKPSSENKLLSTVTDLLAERVPPGWSVESLSGEGASSATLRISSKEGRARTLPVRFADRLSPRAAQGHDEFRDSVVVSPYLTASVRRILEEQGASYVDQTGNMRLVVDEPGLFVLAEGADTNPWPATRRSSLRGVKAARVVIALAKSRPPVGVRELAQLAGTDPGYVSRLLKMLDEEAIVDRTPLGRVASVDWRQLLEHWSEDAPLERRTQATTWLAPRGIGNVMSGLPEVDFRYVLTGSAAASRIAPVAPTRLLSIYIDDPRRAADGLDLRRVDAGANVILLEPDDDGLFERSMEIDGVQQAPIPLLVADLLTGPGRSPAEAQALLDWMEANEEAWRG